MKLIGINKLIFTSFNFLIIFVTSLINLSDSSQVLWPSTVACCFVISYQTVFPCSPQNRPCGWWKHLILQRVGRRQPNVYHKGLILCVKDKNSRWIPEWDARSYANTSVSVNRNRAETRKKDLFPLTTTSMCQELHAAGDIPKWTIALWRSWRKLLSANLIMPFIWTVLKNVVSNITFAIMFNLR